MGIEPDSRARIARVNAEPAMSGRLPQLHSPADGHIGKQDGKRHKRQHIAVGFEAQKERNEGCTEEAERKKHPYDGKHRPGQQR